MKHVWIATLRVELPEAEARLAREAQQFDRPIPVMSRSPSVVGIECRVCQLPYGECSELACRGRIRIRAISVE